MMNFRNRMIKKTIILNNKMCKLRMSMRKNNKVKNIVVILILVRFENSIKIIE